MELIALKNRIIESYRGGDAELACLLNMFDNDVSVYPFNEYEFFIANMMSKGQLTYADDLAHAIDEAFMRSN